MAAKLRNLFLLGTSHVGKSTCALALGAAAGMAVVSTDELGRHPGRPWTGVPEEVEEFYQYLSDDTIHWFLRVHHENMRPVIQNCTTEMRQANRAFVLEGSALRPEYLSAWDISDALSICLYADNDLLRQRIETESNRAAQGKPMKIAIDRFIERSLRENEALAEAANRNGVTLFDVTHVTSAKSLVEKLSAHIEIATELTTEKQTHTVATPAQERNTPFKGRVET